jgi:hypothetical protein
MARSRRLILVNAGVAVNKTGRQTTYEETDSVP